MVAVGYSSSLLSSSVMGAVSGEVLLVNAIAYDRYGGGGVELTELMNVIVFSSMLKKSLSYWKQEVIR